MLRRHAHGSHASWRGPLAWAVTALTLCLTLGCRQTQTHDPVVVDTPDDLERRARLAEAMTTLEKSTGQAHLDARFAFLDFRSTLRPTSRDSALLPRFEALLQSKDAGDVELGVNLVGQVGQKQSLPRLREALKHPNGFVRAKAITTIAWTYSDPELVPFLREAIAHDKETRLEAIRALRCFVKDPAVVVLLHQLLKDPKTVGLATEVLHQASLPFEPTEAVIAQQTYSNLRDGISLDFPEDWPSEATGDDSIVFHNRALDASYGYRIVSLRAASARGASLHQQPRAAAQQLLSTLEHREHLRNELPAEQATPERKLWQATGATDAAEGRYTVAREGKPFVRRRAILVEDARAVVVEGEAPVARAQDFLAVFDRMWPTIRLGSPSTGLADALQAAIDRGAASTNKVAAPP